MTMPTLHRRVLSVTMVATGAALLFIGAVFGALDYAEFRRAMLDRTVTQARVLAANAGAALMFNDGKAGGELLAALAAAPEVEAAALYTEGGRRLAAWHRPGAAPVEIAPSAAHTEDRFTLDAVVVHRPVMFNAEDVGTVYVRADTARWRAALIVRTAMAAGVVLLAFAAAYLVLYRLLRRAVGPVTRLAALMDRVEKEKDYTVRAPAADTAEVNALAQGFNGMLGVIAAHTGELDRHRRYLEEMVATRTAELRDANDRLSSELAERERNHEALLTAASEWRATFDSINDPLCLLDGAGKIRRCNRATTELLGLEFIAVLGQGAFDLIHATAEETTVTAAPLASPSRRATYATQRGGKWFDVTVDPTRDHGGAITGCVHLMVDVTARRALEEQFSQSQKMEAVGRLAGGVAHDFNNILSVMMSCTSFLLDELPPDSPFRADVEEIRKSAQRAAGLTRQLLAFSRKQVINPQQLTVNDVINNLSKMLGRLIGEHIELSMRYAADAGEVFMDPSQLEQILVNLVVNARDAMPSGGKLIVETRRLSVESGESALFEGVEGGDYVVVAVSDTGCGMTEEVRRKAFEPFFTTKAVGKGTGLGLAMVYGAVRQNGGTIHLRSEPGMGTSFTILLKRVGKESPSKTMRALADAPKGGGELVLLVEDEEPVRRSVRRMLERGGYRVEEAGDGEAGLAAFTARKDEVRLVLSDVVMPRMNGVEMAERIKALSPSMKFLHMSGYTDDLLTAQGVSEERTYVLNKPFERDVLLAKVREILERG